MLLHTLLILAMLNGDPLLPFLSSDSAANRRVTAIVDTLFRPWEQREQARLQHDVPQAQLVRFSSHHYQFLSHPDRTEQLMRRFLNGITSPTR